MSSKIDNPDKLVRSQNPIEPGFRRVTFLDLCDPCASARHVEQTTHGFIGPHRCDGCEGTFEPAQIQRYRVLDPEPDTQPDHERPTDPAPPPESTVPPLPKLDPSHLLEEMRQAARDDERWQRAELPTEPARPLVSHLGVDASGNVVPVARNDSRDWLDYGLDTGPRLRVKGLVDPPKPPVAEDHDGWRERHAAIAKALRDGDDHALGKLPATQQILDELHTKEAPKPPVPPLDWDLLEPALVAELREWGRGHQLAPGSIGLQRFFDASAAVRLLFRDGTFEMRFDRASVRAAWREAEGNERRAAALLVQRGTAELAQARRREIITVPDPS